nr:ankyrin repeat domain-containing protein [Kiritimatiellia bacterium]
GADTDAVDVEEHTLWDMAYTLRSKALFDLAKKARVSLLRGRGLSKAVQSGRVEDVREILSHARDVQHAHCDGLTYATDEIVDLLYDAATPPDGDWSTRLPARMSSYTTNSFDIGIQAIENQNSRMLFRLLQTPVDLTRLSRKQTNDGWLHSCQYDKYLEAAIEVDSPGMVTILLEAGKSRGLEFQDWILEGVKSDDVRALLDPEGNFHPQPTVVENSEVMTTSERESPLERNARLIQELDRGKQTSYYLQNAYKVGPYLPIEFRVPSMASVKALFDQPVHLAARRGDLEAVKREIEKGVDLNARGEKGWPVLICALDQGHVDVARWLIREGAEVNMVTHLGSAALAYAAKTGDIELLHEMLQYGADPNVFRNFSHTVLTIACSDADLQVVRFLVDHGAHINLANVNYSRWSVNPLRAAVGANRQEVVTFLLDRGADINAQEIKIEDSPLKTVPEINYGPTALIHAGWEQRDDVEMARLLVERGADISLTFNGQTAEEVARERGNHKVAEYLSGLKNR